MTLCALDSTPRPTMSVSSFLVTRFVFVRESVSSFACEPYGWSVNFETAMMSNTHRGTPCSFSTYDVAFNARQALKPGAIRSDPAQQSPVGVAGRRRVPAAAHGKAVQVDPMKLMLKPPGTRHLKLKCDILLSTFAFTFNWRRYTMVISTGAKAAGLSVSIFERLERLVRRCSLTLLKPTLKLTGTKRLKLKCDILVSTSAFKFNLRHYSLGIQPDLLSTQYRMHPALMVEPKQKP